MAANPGSVRDLLRRYRKLFAAAIVLLLVIVGFFELARVSRTTERSISYSLEMQSVALERWFALNLNFVRSIANLPSVVSGNYDEIFQDFQRIAGANSNFHNLSFVDREGNPVVQSDSGVIPAPKTNFSDRDYFIEAAAGRSYISDVISGRLVGKPIVVFSTPVITDGEFKGLVTGAILFDTILKTILSTKFGESGSFFLLNSRGQTIDLTSDTGSEGEPHEVGRLTGASSLVCRECDGTTYFAKGKKLDRTVFYLVARVDYNEFLTPISANLLYLLIVGLALFSVQLFTTRRVFALLEKSLALLLEGVKKIGNGEYDSLDPDRLERSPNEFRELGLAFNSMAENVQNKTSELEFKSFHDGLTDLYNRAYFMDVMTRMDSGRFGPVTLVVCDIDGLKLINDSLGHRTGDELLIAAAHVLMSASRKSDFVSRVGGDEFAIILPHSTPDTGAWIINRIEEEIQNYKRHEGSLPLNIACGSSCNHDDGRSVEELQREADRAMYAAKQSKRAQTRGEIQAFLASGVRTPHQKPPEQRDNDNTGGS